MSDTAKKPGVGSSVPYPSGAAAVLQGNVLFKILENLPVALFAKDVQDNYRMILWNRRAEQLFDIPRENMLGLTDYDIFPKSEADHFRRFDERVMASGEVVDIAEEPITTVRGTWYGHTVKVPLYDERGRPSILFGLVEDITAQKETAAAVQAAQAADKANQAKSEFLAHMSHELRTPLNSLLGLARLLGGTRLDKQQSEMLSVMAQAGEMLLTTVDDVLDFSKIEAKQVELERIGFALKPIFTQCVNVLQSLASEKGLVLCLDWPTSDPPPVLGDPGRLARILHNLVGNAIKYTEFGSIRVAVRWQQADDGAILLSVKVIDTGIGISADKQQLIFQRFSQAESTTTRKYGGTGLGLAIAQELVQLMDGAIGVESEPNAGSTFWFDIAFPPALAMDTEWAATPVPVVTPLTKLTPATTRILVAEDNALNQLYMEKLLEAYGFAEVKFVENGIEAVKQYRAHPYDIIFMDCHMPEQNGYEATQEIRRLEEDSGNRVPIIAMTANALDGEREKCLAFGMDEYVSKPVNVDRFHQVLCHWVDMPPCYGLPTAAVKKDDDDDASPPIDMSEIRIYSEGNRDKEKFLVRIFEEQTQKVLDTLRHHCVDGASPNWRDAAHLLKGSAGHIGAAKLHTLCAQAQHGGRETASYRRDLLNDIEHEIGRIHRFFAELGLASQPA